MKGFWREGGRIGGKNVGHGGKAQRSRFVGRSPIADVAIYNLAIATVQSLNIRLLTRKARLLILL